MLIIHQNKLENEFLRIFLESSSERLAERIELKDENNWIPLIGSFQNFSTLIFYNKKDLHSKALSIKRKNDNKLIYELNNSEFFINLEITLKDLIHFKYIIKNKKRLKLSKLIANYEILLGNDPDFTWVPHLRPEKDYIISDHVFRSPVIIYKKGDYAFALIPDLDILGTNRPFPTMMNLDLKSEDDKPFLSYGFGNYNAISHILFKHDPKKRMKIKPNTDLSFGYYIKIFNHSSTLEILQTINNFLWETYGKKLLYQNLAPQILPYDINVAEGFKAIERHNFWGNFKINDIECGGIWQKSWMGKKKKKVRFIKPKELKKYRKKAEKNIFSHKSIRSEIIYYFSNSPFWINVFDKFTRNHAIVGRTAEIWNNAWFLNIRTGYSLKFFGDFWKKDDLIDKGDRILNTLLNLPRTEGIFPCVVLPSAPDSNIISYVNGVKAFIYTDDFHVVDSCQAMYYALKYYQDFEKKDEIEKKSSELVNLIEKIQLENGAIPTYITFRENETKPIISEILINSASSGSALMFLTEFYKISKNERIIPIAEKISRYIQKEIIPHDKWHDFEPFFSCTHLPFDFYDNHTKKHVMNALCMYWCAEGFKELYKITKKGEYLTCGERIIAILSLFQQVWKIPYIDFNTFGGFCSQNIDAELSDARQGLFVQTYMEYYLETGKKEYMERAIATLRACWAMQLLRENAEQCPGNVKGIDTLDTIDRGCVTENYGHSGHNLRVPGYIMFDWGVGTSATATAYTKKHFGDIFIDLKEKIVWGIDGIKINSYEFKENSVDIFIDIIPNKKYILFKARDSHHEYEIILNGKSLGFKTKNELDEGFQYNIE